MSRRARSCCGLVALACLGMLLACACGSDSAPTPAGGADATIADAAIADVADAAPATVACGQILPGPPMRATLVEAQPGYADALAALDLDAVIVPIDLTSEPDFVRDLVNYTLGISGETMITQAHLTAAGRLADAVRGAIAVSSDGAIDIRFLRRGLHYFSPCARPLPISLAAVRERYGDYTIWPRVDVPCAAPKDGPRRLSADPQGRAYVAETIVDGVVRETELLLLDTRSDGQLDFAAYTEAGELTDRSTFATASGGSVVSSSPYTCMACHQDTGTGRYSVLIPTGTGAGCGGSTLHRDTRAVDLDAWLAAP